MTKMPPKLVRLGFERDCVEVPLDQIRCPISLPAGIKDSVKYQQIRSTVQAIGLVEPIVVALNSEHTGTSIVLDGRMRLEALRDLGLQRVLCLISTDDEGYTYNKRVNHLSVVQAHRMIVRAADWIARMRAYAVSRAAANAWWTAGGSSPSTVRTS